MFLLFFVATINPSSPEPFGQTGELQVGLGKNGDFGSRQPTRWFHPSNLAVAMGPTQGSGFPMGTAPKNGILSYERPIAKLFNFWGNYIHMESRENKPFKLLFRGPIGQVSIYRSMAVFFLWVFM